MNTTEKKCFIASAAGHGLLVLVILLAPAFFVPEKRPDEPLLTLIPSAILDELRPSGTPGVAPHEMRTMVTPPPPPPPPPPTPAQPQVEQRKVERTPEPEPEPEPRPAPKRVQTDIPKIEPEPKKAASKKAPTKSEPKKSGVKVDLTTSKTVQLSKNKSESKSDSKSKADSKAREDQRRKYDLLAKNLDSQTRAIDHAILGLKNNPSGSTQIYVPGDGNGIYASYSQYVKSVYDAAWVFRDDIADLRISVKATIKVARDGTVINASIDRDGKSGNAVLDKSVLDVLRRVKFIHPFPEGSKDVERTFELNFNPASRRATG